MNFSNLKIISFIILATSTYACENSTAPAPSKDIKTKPSHHQGNKVPESNKASVEQNKDGSLTVTFH